MDYKKSSFFNRSPARNPLFLTDMYISVLVIRVPRIIFSPIAMYNCAPCGYIYISTCWVPGCQAVWDLPAFPSTATPSNWWRMPPPAPNHVRLSQLCPMIRFPPRPDKAGVAGTGEKEGMPSSTKVQQKQRSKTFQQCFQHSCKCFICV